MYFSIEFPIILALSPGALLGPLDCVGRVVHIEVWKLVQDGALGSEESIVGRLRGTSVDGEVLPMEPFHVVWLAVIHDLVVVVVGIEDLVLGLLVFIAHESLASVLIG